MPLGSEGDPPGTQWLKRNLRRGPSGPAPEQQSQQPGAESVKPWLVSSQTPRLGSWQFATRPNAVDGQSWLLYASPPGQDYWTQWSDTEYSLPQILKILPDLRDEFGQ